VLAVVVDQRGRVLRGHGDRRPPVTSTVVVLVGPTGPVLVPVRSVPWSRRHRAQTTACPARLSVLRWLEL